jgi:hypothetical protein
MGKNVVQQGAFRQVMHRGGLGRGWSKTRSENFQGPP